MLYKITKRFYIQNNYVNHYTEYIVSNWLFLFTYEEKLIKLDNESDKVTNIHNLLSERNAYLDHQGTLTQNRNH